MVSPSGLAHQQRRHLWWKHAGPSVLRAETRLVALANLALKGGQALAHKPSDRRPAPRCESASAARCMQLPARSKVAGTERPLRSDQPRRRGHRGAPSSLTRAKKRLIRRALRNRLTPCEAIVSVQKPRKRHLDVVLEARFPRRRRDLRRQLGTEARTALRYKGSSRQLRRVIAYVDKRRKEGRWFSSPYLFNGVRRPATGVYLWPRDPSVLRTGKQSPTQRWRCRLCRTFCPGHEAGCLFKARPHVHRNT